MSLLKELFPMSYFKDLPINILCYIFTGIAIFVTVVYFTLKDQHEKLKKRDVKITRKTDRKEEFRDMFAKKEDEEKEEITEEDEHLLANITTSIEDIFRDPEYQTKTGPNKINYFMTKCQLNSHEIQTIQKLTVSQSKSMLWFSIRNGRITSSNFGGAISLARRNADPTKTFMNYILKTVDISNIPAVKYGLDYEDTAIRDYEREFKVRVVRSGIVMDQCGLLGGSPDGLVDHDGIIEVKCPYKIRDIDSTDDLDWLDYLRKNDQGAYDLSTSHKYYHQVQGNIYLTNRNYCDFIVWSTKVMYVLRIHRDPEWEQNIGLLQTYYIEKVLPRIECYYNDMTQNDRQLTDS